MRGPALTTMRLRPRPDEGGSCPRCARPLELERLHLPGWRLLMEGHCPGCGHDYLQDLPAGHPLLYPSSLDLTAGESHGMWFQDALAEGWASPDDEPVRLSIEGEARRRGSVVLLPCLDPVYGHALLRLLNAQQHLDRSAGEELVVLVPSSLRALVPEGVAETWVVDEPLARLRGRLTDLARRLDEELDRFDEVWLSATTPHPHPSTFDLRRFTRTAPGPRAGGPRVVLSLRGDRTWGAGAGEQRKRYTAVLAALRERFDGLEAVSVGVVDPGSAPDGADDLTDPRPDLDTERRWLQAMDGADLALGVHGSNLLLPSGLASATVELLPEDRWTNYAQATLATWGDPLLAVYSYRVLHGAPDLADVAPERVAAVAAAILAGLPRFTAHLLGPLAGQSPDGEVVPNGPADSGDRWWPAAPAPDAAPPARRLGLLRRKARR